VRKDHAGAYATQSDLRGYGVLMTSKTKTRKANGKGKQPEQTVPVQETAPVTPPEQIPGAATQSVEEAHDEALGINFVMERLDKLKAAILGIAERVEALEQRPSVAPVANSKPARPARVLTQAEQDALHASRQMYFQYLASGGKPVPRKVRDANGNITNKAEREAARKAWEAYRDSGKLPEAPVAQDKQAVNQTPTATQEAPKSKFELIKGSLW
jgi:hypothetical protein